MTFEFLDPEDEGVDLEYLLALIAVCEPYKDLVDVEVAENDHKYEDLFDLLYWTYSTLLNAMEDPDEEVQ